MLQAIALNTPVRKFIDNYVARSSCSQLVLVVLGVKNWLRLVVLKADLSQLTYID